MVLSTHSSSILFFFSFDIVSAGLLDRSLNLNTKNSRAQLEPVESLVTVHAKRGQDDVSIFREYDSDLGKAKEVLGW